MAAITITTERLHLREFQLEDQAAIQEYAADLEVTRFTSWGPNTPDMTNEVLHSWLDEQRKSPRVEFPVAVTRRTDNALIGGAGIGQVDWQSGSAIFGYVLQRSVWGQGFATEAGAAIVTWAFAELHLKKLTAHCDSANCMSSTNSASRSKTV